MTKKKRNILIGTGFGLFFGVIFGFNIYTFIGIKNHTGYTFGTIIKNWESEKSNYPYSRYVYKVDGITYQGRQGGKFFLDSTFLIVYDNINPKFSMIANYPPELINENSDINEINPELVDYSWWDYLPGDNLSDLWK